MKRRSFLAGLALAPVVPFITACQEKKVEPPAKQSKTIVWPPNIKWAGANLPPLHYDHLIITRHGDHYYGRVL
jgi:hypothetical protein